jgi:diguanylate cyclase (GGDEF)-like protein
MRGEEVTGEESLHGRTDSQLFAAAAAAVARGDDLDEQLAELLGLAAERLGANAGVVYLLDQDHDELNLTVTLGIEDETAAEAGSIGRATESHDAVADVVRLRKPLPVDDAGRVVALRGSKTALLVPLVVRRDGIEIALGAMGLGFATKLPAAKVLDSAEPIADLAAVAIERALALSLGSERAEWFDRLTHTDPLTGLPNRRTLDRLLELELARAGRQGQPLSIAIFGIDRFTDIVIAGGNSAGDDALRRVAQVLAESVRLVDNIARFSSDEFILVAPGPEVMVVAQRLVKRIATLGPVHGKPLSVSAGLAAYPNEGRTPAELLDAAETALKAAREAGGDRVAAAAAD